MFYTLEDLKKRVDQAIAVNRYAKDRTVIIRVSEPSIGAMAGVQITQAYCGIDWDNSKFIIQPSVPLFRKAK